MVEKRRELVEQSDALPGGLTQEEIFAAYARGPEAVVALFARLREDAAIEPTTSSENVREDGLLSPSPTLPSEFDEFASGAEAAPLTATEFDKFLAYLSPDRDEAARLYNHHQNALTRFFINHQASDPHICAVRVMEILQTQIAAGRQIDDLDKYRFGVARNILLKDRARRPQSVELPEQADENPSALAALEKAAREKCMTACLQSLPDNQREAVLDYYSGKKQDKERREALAKRLSVNPNALRTYVHRITTKLKTCLESCLKKSARKV